MPAITLYEMIKDKETSTAFDIYMICIAAVLVIFIIIVLIKRWKDWRDLK